MRKHNTNLSLIKLTMKRILSTLLVLLPVLSYSQIDKPIKKGNLNIGGSGSISNTYNYESTYKLLSAYVNSTINYFFVNNLATGLSTSINYEKYNHLNSTYYGIGPNIKYYFNNGILLRAESIFVKGSGNFATSQTFIFKSGLGYAFFINSKVSIEPALLYYHVNLKSNIPEKDSGAGLILPPIDFSVKENTFVFEIGFSIFL